MDTVFLSLHLNPNQESITTLHGLKPRKITLNNTLDPAFSRGTDPNPIDLNPDPQSWRSMYFWHLYTDPNLNHMVKSGSKSRNNHNSLFAAEEIMFYNTLANSNKKNETMSLGI